MGRASYPRIGRQPVVMSLIPPTVGTFPPTVGTIVITEGFHSWLCNTQDVIHRIQVAQDKVQVDKLKDNYLHSPHNVKAYRYIKHQYSSPMVALENDCGQYEPVAMDKILRDAWDKIYKGNSSDHQQMVQNYLTKYSEYLYVAPTFDLPHLDADMLFQVVHEASDSALGLDQWTYNDLKFLPREVVQIIADMLTRIEQWGSGLSQCLQIRPICCQKIQMTHTPLLHTVSSCSLPPYTEYGLGPGSPTCSHGSKNDNLRVCMEA